MDLKRRTTMNVKRHLYNCNNLFIAIAGICVLAFTTVGVALAEDNIVDKHTREIEELRKMIDERVVVPIGTIMPYGGDLSKIKKQGWLPCDGAEYKSTKGSEYYGLYEVIGTNFGGSKDRGKFNVPDLRGRFVRGVDHGTGRDPDTKNRAASKPGGNTGDNLGSVQDDAFQGHGHETNAISSSAKKSTAMGGLSWKINTQANALVSRAIKDKDFDDPKISNETRPKNVYVNWIIKAKLIQK
jgi:microcystin-dependent protein